MRLAVLHSGMDFFGGAERLTHDLSHALGERGHDVCLLTPAYRHDWWGQPHSPAYGVERITVPWWVPFFNSRRVERRVVARRIRARLVGWDAVLGLDVTSWRWAAHALRGQGPPLFWYCHGLERRVYWQAAERTFTQFLEAKAAPTEACLEPLVAELGRGDSTPSRRRKNRNRRELDRRFLSWTSGVLTNSAYVAEGLRLALDHDADVCLPGIAIPRVKAQNQRSGLLVVTAFRPSKNIPTILAGLAHARTALGRDDLRLTILGRGAEHDRIQRMVQEFCVASQVTLMGFVEGQALYEHYASCRALVHIPSCEPFGLVLVEALACGCRVLTSDHGGPAELAAVAPDIETVDPFDPEAVGRAMCRIHDSPARETTETASEALREFTATAMAERVEHQITALDSQTWPR